MFGLSSNTHKNVEDVVIGDAEDVTIENPEDVFIEPQAVAGTVKVVDVGDVFVETQGKSQPNPYRDFVVDEGDDAKIKGCEDVKVERGAVEGDLVIKNTVDDVFIQTTEGVELVDVEDVFVQTQSVGEGDSVRVVDAADVWLRDEAVATDVTAEDPEDILQKGSGAVARGVSVDEPEEEAPLHLVDTEDVLIETSAVEGEVVAESPEGVVDGASF